MSSIISIAILITCHNRKIKTLDCLSTLYGQSLPICTELSCYLVDDGSTDGTVQAVKKNYPLVSIISGNGNLFWGGGTHLAFQEAVKNNHSFYLWLNDDTVLYQNAIAKLLTTYEKVSSQGLEHSIIVGSTQDPCTQELTYGGCRKRSRWHPFHFSKVTPAQEPQLCDTMNGNCVLIPHKVVQLVGLLDPAFSHYAGDFDYGLRAKALGCSIWVAPGYIGTCTFSKFERSESKSLTLKESLSKIFSKKGMSIGNTDLHPFWEWKRLTQRHGGYLWPIYWLMPYRRLFWQFFRNRFN